MRLIKLTLKNVYQYSNFEFEYKCGITGVFGRNGSGKSNLIDEAQFFALTGQTSDNKEEMLKWGCAEGYTEIDFEHDGKEYYLRRNLHNSTAFMRWSSVTEKGDERGAKKIDILMQNMLGMTYDVFRETCFCPQDGLVSILRMPAAQRLTYFQKLANATKAETLRKHIQERLNTVPEYPDRSSDIELLSKAISGTKENVRELLIAQATEQNTVVSDLDKASIYQQLALPSQEMIAMQISQLSKQMTEKMALAAVVEDRKKGLLGGLTQPPVISADEEKAERQFAQRQMLEKQYVDVEEAIRQLPALKQVPTDSSIEDLEPLRQALLEQAALYTMAKSGVCPTCKREFDLPQDKATIISVYEETKQFLESEEKRAQALLREQQLITQHNTRVSANLESLVKQRAQLEQQLLPLRSVVFDPAALQEKRKLLEEWVKKSKQVQDMDREIAKAIAERDAAQDKIKQFETQPCLSAVDRTDLNTKLAKIEEKEKKLQALQNALAQEQVRLDMQQKQLAQLHTEMETRAKYQKVRAQLERSRDILHRNNLPRIVMQRMLSGLNAYMDFYLHKFDTDFSARIDDEFNFKALFKEQEIDASRLSGGQSVTLAIAFRFALSEYFAKSIPLLVLDEPTVWLDEVNIGRMVEVLQMARTFTEKGVYVLVATHEPQLSAAMSRVVHVDAK